MKEFETYAMAIAEQIFELFVQGADIPAPVKFNVPEHQLTAQLEPGTPLRLKVRVTDVPEQEADAEPRDSRKNYIVDFS
jgi:hypothetical protein